MTSARRCTRPPAGCCGSWATSSKSPRSSELEPAHAATARDGRRLWVVEVFGRGGIARYAADVANLAGPLLPTTVATTTAGPASGLRTPFETWFPVGRGSAVEKLTAAARGIATCLARVRPGDLVWLQLGMRPAFELALGAAVRVRRARLVATLHNRAPHGRPGVSRLVLLAARRADRVLVHTTALHDWARQEGLDARLLPFPPPDLDHVAPAGRHDRRSLGVPDGRRVVLVFGNLFPYKGVETLLRALAVAADRDPSLAVQLVLAGQHQPGDDPLDLARRLGVSERVSRLAGYVADAELLDLLGCADAVALPYRSIDHSGAGALAAAHGVPALASDLPTLREIFGDAAVYVPPGDINALAGALAGLDGRLPRLRHAARAGVGRPDLASRYRALIEDLP